MQKDQLNAAKDLTQLDAERALQQSQVDADSSLARSVVTVAGALVVLLIVVLLITTRRQPATPNSSLYPDAPYIIQATRQREALPDVSVIVPDVYQAALPMQQSIVRRG